MADPYVGEIRPFGFNFAPVNWALCAGQILAISSNTALFSILGTTYGGNGTSTFALPDLRSRMALGMGQGQGLSDYVEGEEIGTETVTVLITEMASHSHTPYTRVETGTADMHNVPQAGDYLNSFQYECECERPDLEHTAAGKCHDAASDLHRLCRRQPVAQQSPAGAGDQLLHLPLRRLSGAQLTPDDIALRPETGGDEAFLRRLNIAVRWNEFAALPLPAEQKVALLQQQYEARHNGYRADFPDADFHVVERAGVPIGRFYVRRGKREHYLVDIAILPDQAGRGVGGTLLDRMLTDAARAGVPATLRVDHLNPAKRLYLRKGFVEIEDLGLDALMRWTPS